MRPAFVLYALWIGWLLSWLIAAAWSNRTEKRPAFRTQAPYRIPQLIGVLLLIMPSERYAAVLRLWRMGASGVWACIALTALGIAFAWWARVHLGKLWSLHVVRKADHRVVDSGPYAIVRHPIYTGMLLALGATGAAKGTVLAIGGVLLIALGVYIKARAEESWLSQELDPGAYADYRRRVPMLLPFGARNKG
jgi:protein-S-isoprenylcysteine O-methyltransferase Ste14